MLLTIDTITSALKQADLVVLLGARLNWMLHFGKTPRFAPHAKFVQVDLHAEELGNNTNSSNCIQVQADIKSFCQQVCTNLSRNVKWLD